MASTASPRPVPNPPIIQASGDGDSARLKQLLAGCEKCHGGGKKGLFGPTGMGLLNVACSACGGAGRAGDIDAKNANDTTALQLASYKGRQDCVKILLENRADVHVRNKYGHSALTPAALNGKTEVVKMLLAAEADVNAVTKHGETALVLASHAGHGECVAALLAGGANSEIKTHAGHTALSLASRRRRVGAERVLRRHAGEEVADDDRVTPLHTPKGTPSASGANTPVRSMSLLEGFATPPMPLSPGETLIEGPVFNRRRSTAEYQEQTLRDQVDELESQVVQEKRALAKRRAEAAAAADFARDTEERIQKHGESPQFTAEIEKAKDAQAQALRGVESGEARVAALENVLKKKQDLLEAIRAS